MYVDVVGNEEGVYFVVNSYDNGFNVMFIVLLFLLFVLLYV